MTRAVDPQTLESLRDLLDGKWFDAEGIAFDENRAVVVVPIEVNPQRGWKSRLPWPITKHRTADAQLCIAGAQSLDIKDDAHIRYYELDELIYDTSDSTIRLKSGFPIDVCVRVERIDVELQPLTASTT